MLSVVSLHAADGVDEAFSALDGSRELLELSGLGLLEEDQRRVRTGRQVCRVGAVEKTEECAEARLGALLLERRDSNEQHLAVGEDVLASGTAGLARPDMAKALGATLTRDLAGCHRR